MQITIDLMDLPLDKGLAKTYFIGYQVIYRVVSKLVANLRKVDIFLMQSRRRASENEERPLRVLATRARPKRWPTRVPSVG